MDVLKNYFQHLMYSVPRKMFSWYLWNLSPFWSQRILFGVVVLLLSTYYVPNTVRQTQFQTLF